MTQNPSENPPDIRVGNAYRPDIAAASAALNQVLNQPLPEPGKLIYDPDIKRSLPQGWEPVTNHSHINGFASKLVQETVAQLQGDINRAVTTSTGFQPYVLESPAKFIFPLDAPMVSLTPRMVSKGTDIEHWKSVLSMFYYGGVNSGPMGQTNWGGSAEGSNTVQGPVYNVQSYQATYQTIFEYNTLTFQAQARSRALEGDLLARLKANLIYGLKLQEENWLINGASKMWQPAPALVTASTTGGNLTDDAAGGFWVQVTAVNANGETLPSTNVGPIALASETETGSLSITFSGQLNATSYNVYIGTGATKPSNSNMFICIAADFLSGATPVQPADPLANMSITTTLVTAPTSGAHPPTSNGATVSLNVFDGAMSLCYMNPNGGGNPSVGEQGMTSLVIQPAAANGQFAVQDIQYLMRKMYSQARAQPSHIFVSAVEAATLDLIVGTNSNFRVIAEPTSAGGIAGVTAGIKVRNILNPVTGAEVPVVCLPFLPQGTIMLGSFHIPFAAPDIQDPPFRVMVNQDYTSVDYPPAQGALQTWGFGCYVDETLVNQFQGGWGLINGIQPPVGI